MFQVKRVNYSPWNIETLMQLVLAFDILIASDWLVYRILTVFLSIFCAMITKVNKINNW